MKNIAHILFICLISASTFYSCDSDPCEDITCLNGGDCDNGTCYCITGFEGAECQTQSRTKFISGYTVSELCGTNEYNYDMTVASSGTNVTDVTISNFGGLDIIALGTIDGEDITIPLDSTVINSITVLYEGTGRINGSVLTIDYSTTFNGSTMSCTATCIQN